MAYRIGPLSQIPAGEGRAFVVGSTEIAVFHTRQGDVFATQAHCPHRSGPLADGLTDGASVVCPLHDRVFSLTSGEGVGNDCRIAVYAVTMADEQILVDVIPTRGDFDRPAVG